MDGGADRAKPRPHEAGDDAADVLPRERAKARPDSPSAREDVVLPGQRIARLATAQKGPISRRQLERAGLGRSSVGRRAGKGELHRVFRGIYLPGHEALAPLARESAALLAIGADAVLSHESAALAWGIIEDYTGDVHVTVVGRKLHCRAGLRVHRTSARPPIRRRHGLPVTSPAQTLLDLAAVKSRHLEHALIEAHGARLVTADELAKAIKRAGRKPGTRVLRELIGANASGFTRSEAERRLRALLRAARLPEPRTNATILGFMVDCLWPAQRLVVEFDGYRFHGHRRAFEVDRRRDAALAAAGYVVIRITWLQLTREPYAVLATLAAALARRDPH
jgi:very-short-patch-repair endonuclease